MGRRIRAIKIGSQESIEKLKVSGTYGRLFEIDGAKVYWSVNDVVLVVASENWREFFTGGNGLNEQMKG